MTELNGSAGLVCTYCGCALTKANRNREHVIARQLFASPRPTDLDKAIVLSCRPCNELPKPAEDYFTLMLAFSRAGLSDRGLKYRADIGDRAWKKDGGLRRKMAKTLIPVPLIRPSGLIHLGMAQELNWRLIDQVLEKWVRGLHFKTYGCRLDKISLHTNLSFAKENIAEEFRLANKGAASWAGVFNHWYLKVSDIEVRWAFQVWDKLCFYAQVLTEPANYLIRRY